MGIRLVMTDAQSYDATRTAVFLLAAIHAVHPDKIRIGGSFDRLAGGAALREAIVRGDKPEEIVDTWKKPLAAYQERVKPFLLYQ